jgi:hypothetical protein
VILDKVQPDKALHFMGGALVGAVGGIAATRLGINPWMGCVGASFIAGLLKEIADARANVKATGKIRGVPVGYPHGVEGLDALATTLGGVVVAAPLFVL